MTTSADQNIFANGVKLLGEIIAPGASLVMDGRVREGTAHFAAGLGARLLLGGPALVLASLAVRANSFSKSVTDKAIHEHFSRNSAVPPTTEDHLLPAKKAVLEPAPHDDLKKIEGIGPKLADLLQSKNICTFQALAATDVEDLRSLLRDAGSRYRFANPATWPQQAALAADGRWQDLKALQEGLKGGNRTGEAGS